MTRRTQQSSILDFIGSDAPIKPTPSSTHPRISFTATRAATQSRPLEPDERGDEVDSEDEEERFDKLRLESSKTRLDSDDEVDSRVPGRPSITRPKKKVMADSDSDDAMEIDKSKVPHSQGGSQESSLPIRTRRRVSTTAIVVDDSSSEADCLVVAGPSTRTSRTGVQHTPPRNDSEDQEEQITPLKRPARTTRSSARKRPHFPSAESDDESNLPIAVPGSSTRSSVKRKTRSDGPVTPPSPLLSSGGEDQRMRKKKKEVDYYESDDALDLVTSARTRSEKARAELEAGKGKKRVEPEDEMEFEADPTASTTAVDLTQEIERPVRMGTKLHIFSSGSESEGVNGSSQPGRRSDETVTEDEDLDDGPSRAEKRPSKGLRRKKGRTRDPDDSEEEIDGKQLLKEIELDMPVILKNRMRDRDKKSNFQRNLAKLKRHKEARQAGRTIDVDAETESDTDESSSLNAYEDAGTIIIDEDSVVEEEEENFIDDDSNVQEDFDARILPAQFRMSNYQDLEHHFKVVSQYHIHLVVAGPSFVHEADTQYFRTALDAFRRRFEGMRDSLITSSVWKPEFKRSLERYPELVIGVLDEAEMGCDACHLGGRMSKYEGTLDGLPYDEETFEDINEDDSGEESDESELESVAALSKGPFKLGKYCQERARVFHEFSHWEYDLYHAYRLPYRQLLRRANLDPDSTSSQTTDHGNGGNDEDDDPLSSDEEIKVIEKRPTRPFVPVAGFTKDTIRDGDEVLEYFDRKGFVKSAWVRLETLMQDARNLETRR